ncbi:MAG: hypothetical protein CVU65_09850 [Deltaproteobacteria bacterium HGW-Deltaproteobacteria-22]|jgi:hypothetical protein|nr:MAG: hypothetical protein CVU65_09850 [Deltaproteobacteria bacterium HGW-Deltaproteobacteria-22]
MKTRPIFSILLALFLISCSDDGAKSRPTWSPVERASGLETAVFPDGDSFYIDPENGDDSGTGSFEDPWQNLQFVLDNYVRTQEYDSYPWNEAQGMIPRNPDGPVGPGDTLVLRAGNHGPIDIRRARNEDFIAIRAMDGETATLERLSIVSASHWIVEDLHVTQDATDVPTQGDLLEIENHNWTGPASFVIVRGCRFETTADASAWTLEDWNQRPCNGASLTGDHLLLEDNLFRNVNFGISVSGDFTDVIGNTVENFAGDGLRGLGDDLVFRGNTVKNCYDVNENHDDGFQSWSIDGHAPRRVVLEGNTILNYTDPNQPFRGALQGIGCFDGFYQDWYVANNLVIVDHWHGITFLGGDGVTVIHNTVVNRDPASELTPWIMIDDHKDGSVSRNCLIANNLVANRITAGSGVTETTNLVVGDGDLAVVYEDPDQLDFTPAAGSPVLDAATALPECPAVDHDGVPRPQGPGYDLGAFERTP